MTAVVSSSARGLWGLATRRQIYSDCHKIPCSYATRNDTGRNRSRIFGTSTYINLASAATLRGRGPHRRSAVGKVSPLGASSISCSDLAEDSDGTGSLETGRDKDREVEYVPPPTRVTAKGRIVAVGDLHGDLLQTMRVLQLAGVMATPVPGEPARWIGGDTVFIQMGDILDRGDSEIGILRMLWQLGEGAKEAGGAVYIINGNHETLNISGDFRYVTPGAFKESAMVALGSTDFGNPGISFTMQARARLALFSPGAPLARRLANNPTILVVNDTVFAHGGLLPSHAEYGIERINEEVSRWMMGGSEPPEIAIFSPDSVVWNRLYSRDLSFPSERYYACEVLEQTLDMVGAKRLVVGHTPQPQGCNEECEGQVWRIDVGMSSGVMGSPVQAIEIKPVESSDIETDNENVVVDRRARSEPDYGPFPDVEISVLSFT
mmetsp:Transcript_39350/g.47692  ORF Transcript_39350/g.47692 Transcript_39350/m.47692 type:complete len:435 (+) Transcript_39350:66-1370(+)|eukprot:CAMPEP_0197851714 /NCGR_PEP_ID=MMETSP1438-20131217/18686_1 /TAXON_ID=1461541 /ORGANISM="Pterosperma sp., Strain CCMP1384" /LENGTH=434 /DNA_ID=CAMNT_0043465421 /DNA_START=64 /DNA_END=1368 /DNA_ORIENTATION=-